MQKNLYQSQIWVFKVSKWVVDENMRLIGEQASYKCGESKAFSVHMPTHSSIIKFLESVRALLHETSAFLCP